jgi:hypothetical protein
LNVEVEMLQHFFWLEMKRGKVLNNAPFIKLSNILDVEVCDPDMSGQAATDV